MLLSLQRESHNHINIYKEMSKYSEMTDKQYYAALDEFCKKYNAPACEPIKVLDLIMRREFAEEILRGEKRVEIRQFS